MKVHELIASLQECPQDLEVTIYYDGDARLVCDGAFYLSDIEIGNPDERVDSLVLCETADVYNYKNAKWFFKKDLKRI